MHAFGLGAQFFRHQRAKLLSYASLHVHCTVACSSVIASTCAYVHCCSPTDPACSGCLTINELMNLLRKSDQQCAAQMLYQLGPHPCRCHCPCTRPPPCSCPYPSIAPLAACLPACQCLILPARLAPQTGRKAGFLKQQRKMPFIMCTHDHHLVKHPQ
jgi:hypothetical protein